MIIKKEISTSNIPILIGISHGVILSSFLFNLVIDYNEHIIQTTSQSARSYADDTVILAKTKKTYHSKSITI